jgi:hypothetical protein
MKTRTMRHGWRPIHKLLVGRDPVNGEDLASQPTLSRFENAPDRKEFSRLRGGVRSLADGEGRRATNPYGVVPRRKRQALGILPVGSDLKDLKITLDLPIEHDEIVASRNVSNSYDLSNGRPRCVAGRCR